MQERSAARVRGNLLVPYCKGGGGVCEDCVGSCGIEEHVEATESPYAALSVEQVPVEDLYAANPNPVRYDRAAAFRRSFTASLEEVEPMEGRSLDEFMAFPWWKRAWLYFTGGYLRFGADDG